MKRVYYVDTLGALLETAMVPDDAVAFTIMAPCPRCMYPIHSINRVTRRWRCEGPDGNHGPDEWPACRIVDWQGGAPVIEEDGE